MAAIEAVGDAALAQPRQVGRLVAGHRHLLEEWSVERPRHRRQDRQEVGQRGQREGAPRRAGARRGDRGELAEGRAHGDAIEAA
jgi:hypothetical protein